MVLRILVLGTAGSVPRDLLPPGDHELVHASGWEEALARLRSEHFDSVVAPPGDTALWNQARRLLESQRVLEAARAMAAVSPEQLLEMTVEQRIAWLRESIRRAVRDVLHYTLIEIRVLDRHTNQLQILLTEGMNAPGASRPLFAAQEGNGVTGHVAATGHTYLCADTSLDPLYIQGATGARSSLTVPLVQGGEVIGTFNIESLQANGFDEEDVYFVEVFSREIAQALGVLELLSAEQRTSAALAVETVSHEVALPVDDILAAGTELLDRYIGHEPGVAEKLRLILASARSIKQAIQKVGESLSPPPQLPLLVPAEPRPLLGLRVLVADNDDRVRRSAHGILGRWGCVVETARDGDEAVTMARLGQYDAILADIRLPDMTGYDAFQQLRQAQPQARVILMTAYGYDPSHSLVKARQEGLRFVLYKPFRIDQLREALTAPGDATRPQPLGAGRPQE